MARRAHPPLAALLLAPLALLLAPTPAAAQAQERLRLTIDDRWRALDDLLAQRVDPETSTLQLRLQGATWRGLDEEPSGTSVGSSLRGAPRLGPQTTLELDSHLSALLTDSPDNRVDRSERRGAAVWRQLHGHHQGALHLGMEPGNPYADLSWAVEAGGWLDHGGPRRALLHRPDIGPATFVDMGAWAALRPGFKTHHEQEGTTVIDLPLKAKRRQVGYQGTGHPIAGVVEHTVSAALSTRTALTGAMLTPAKCATCQAEQEAARAERGDAPDPIQAQFSGDLVSVAYTRAEFSRCDGDAPCDPAITARDADPGVAAAGPTLEVERLSVRFVDYQLAIHDTVADVALYMDFHFGLDTFWIEGDPDPHVLPDVMTGFGIRVNATRVLFNFGALPYSSPTGEDAMIELRGEVEVESTWVNDTVGVNLTGAWAILQNTHDVELQEAAEATGDELDEPLGAGRFAQQGQLFLQSPGAFRLGLYGTAAYGYTPGDPSAWDPRHASRRWTNEGGLFLSWEP